MTYILIILKVQVRLKKKVGLFCKKIIFSHYLRNAIYRCIVIFLGQCIDTLKFCIVPSLITRQKLFKVFINIKNAGEQTHVISFSTRAQGSNPFLALYFKTSINVQNQALYEYCTLISKLKHC